MPCDFNSVEVRDLSWTIGSPGLLLNSGASDRVSDVWCRLAWYECIPWLRELDAQPQALRQHLARYRGDLLGMRFEQLVAYWLGHWRRTALLAHGARIKHHGRTLGEFDFLFYDHLRKQAIHWEVAVKFYLRWQQADGGHVWLGPNPHDTLAGKLDKVFNKQLQAQCLPGAERVLARLGIEQPHSEAFIKGYLFYPVEGAWQQPDSIPEGISPDHLKGWWSRYPQAALPDGSCRSHWTVLERFAWLSSARSPSRIMSTKALNTFLADHFARQHRPVLIAELARDGLGFWREVSRGFIVGPQWPHRS